MNKFGKVIIFLLSSAVILGLVIISISLFGCAPQQQACVLPPIPVTANGTLEAKFTKDGGIYFDKANFKKLNDVLVARYKDEVEVRKACQPKQ